MDHDARRHFLARMLGQKDKPTGSAELSPQAAVLVVDDSRTVNIALQRILESAGYQVHLADICCGRAMISKGFLDRAKLEAEDEAFDDEYEEAA